MEALNAYWLMLNPDTVPTDRDLNSLPYNKALYAAVHAVQVDGAWLVDGVPIRAFNDPSYVLGRPETTPVQVLTPEERYALDLSRNGGRYVLENQYLILCDILRQALGQEPIQEKLGFDELPVMMLQLKSGSEASYEKMRDAMQMLNMALIRYDVKWWDDCVWHTQPELVESVNQILGMVQ